LPLKPLRANGYSGKPRDNKNKPPPREKIIPGGPEQIATELPAAAIQKALQDAGIHSVRLSKDAGGYLCNECFYRLMAVDKSGALAGVKVRWIYSRAEHWRREREKTSASRWKKFSRLSKSQCGRRRWRCSKPRPTLAATAK